MSEVNAVRGAEKLFPWIYTAQQEAVWAGSRGRSSLNLPPDKHLPQLRVHFSCVELTSFFSILLKLFRLFLHWIPLASTSSTSTLLCLHLQGILLPALLAFFWVFCIFTSFGSPAAVGLVKKGSKILANSVSRKKNYQNTLEIWVELFHTHKGSYFDFSVLNTSGL